MRDIPQIQAPMKPSIADLMLAVLISFIVLVPFAILEFLNQTITRQNASGLIVLFGLMWLLPAGFILILMPILRTMRAGQSVLANPINFLLRVAFSVVIAMTWGSLVIDQMPCFLGVPNCD